MSDDDLLSPQTFGDEPVTDEPTDNPAEALTPSDPPPPEEPKAEQMVPLAALQETRSEAKALKERLAQLEQQAAIQNAPHPPDIRQDPEGYQAWVAYQGALMQSNVTAGMSEMKARMTHTDTVVDAAFAAAQEAGIVDQFRGRPDAWGDLVKWHKSQEVMRAVGDDPTAYRERMRQEIIAEIKAEGAKSAASQPAPSLAGQINLGTRNDQPWAGPTPLDEILGGKGEF